MLWGCPYIDLRIRLLEKSLQKDNNHVSKNMLTHLEKNQ